ncbi:MAG: hypothetical protein KDH15_18115 [Rhodocyclaceae bacterium]|nr:hypothetical protein [Rhodocyclaceae bacterium]
MPEADRSLSLRARLLGVSAAVLLAFVVLTGAVLDRAFRDSADAAQGERLEALLYLLMGALDVAADGGLSMPGQLPEARLAVPGSGLYAAIVAGDGRQQWTSGSTLGLAIPFARGLAAGERRNEVQAATDGPAYRVVSQGVRWAVEATPRQLTFSVAAPLAARELEVRAYRRSLWSALAVMAVLLLLALILVQNWGLGPLRQLARRLAAIESGDATEVGGRFPAELAPLAENLDRVLRRERAQLERYRGALGDLAHSLKTPLAVLRSSGAANPAEVGEQLERMENIVQYQLQRATTAGASQSAQPLPLAPLVERLLATMAKVHAGRRLTLGHDIADALQVRLDEGDAMELLGNLLDNACKWARSRVSVQAERREGGLLLVVEDDGPGIADPARLLGRGQRGDETIPGHGIGLAIVRDIALAYLGELRIERAACGGARVEVWLGQA